MKQQLHKKLGKNQPQLLEEFECNTRSSRVHETTKETELLRAIGLYQLLHPTRGIDGRFRKSLAVGLRLLTVPLFAQAFAMFYVAGTLDWFLVLAVFIVFCLQCMFKGYVMLTNSDQMWSVLDVIRSRCPWVCGVSDPHRDDYARLSTVLRAYIAFSAANYSMAIVAPWFIDDYNSIANGDGTVNNYRATICGFWIPVSESVFNSPVVWSTVYLVEVTYLGISVASSTFFDCYVITVGYVIASRLHTLSISYENLVQPYTAPDINGINHNYTGLIRFIKYNQKIIKKLDTFYDIIRTSVITQIINSSYFIVSLTCIFTWIHYILGQSIFSVSSVKLICGFQFGIIQLYIFCSLFKNIDTEKSMVNFGLYSSDWTAMDLLFKKTILLAMVINSAHKRVMKLAPNAVLNLKMFSKVIQFSYSVASVLARTRRSE